MVSLLDRLCGGQFADWISESEGTPSEAAKIQMVRYRAMMDLDLLKRESMFTVIKSLTGGFDNKGTPTPQQRERARERIKNAYIEELGFIANPEFVPYMGGLI